MCQMGSGKFTHALQALWEGYVTGMDRTAFNADTDLYVASGLHPTSSGRSGYRFIFHLRHTSSVYSYLHGDRKESRNQWINLPKFLEASMARILELPCSVSGSERTSA